MRPSDFFTRPVRRWQDFYKDFYGQEIYLWEIEHAFIAWLVAHRDYVDDKPIFNGSSLQFSRPHEDFTVFWPPRVADIIALGGDCGDIVKIRFRIFNNITDPWDEVLDIKYLPDIIGSFLWINDPDDDRIVVWLGEYQPQVMEYRELERLISYPRCTCRGCSSPICVVKRYR